MSRVLVLKCEHVPEVMEISDLTVSSSASVKGVFMGVVSTVAYTSFISFDGRKSFQTCCIMCYVWLLGHYEILVSFELFLGHQLSGF